MFNILDDLIKLHQTVIITQTKVRTRPIGARRTN